MADNEDIVAFLNRFELELTNRNIPLDNFQSYLPSSLTGQFKEAYYNNLSMCPTYQDIRLVLLNAGGYSVTECLNHHHSAECSLHLIIVLA